VYLICIFKVKVSRCKGGKVQGARLKAKGKGQRAKGKGQRAKGKREAYCFRL